MINKQNPFLEQTKKCGKLKDNIIMYGLTNEMFN